MWLLTRQAPGTCDTYSCLTRMWSIQMALILFLLLLLAATPIDQVARLRRSCLDTVQNSHLW